MSGGVSEMEMYGFGFALSYLDSTRFAMTLWPFMDLFPDHLHRHPFSVFVSPSDHSAVVGSIIRRIWRTEFAGKPPSKACLRIKASDGAM